MIWKNFDLNIVLTGLLLWFIVKFLVSRAQSPVREEVPVKNNTPLSLQVPLGTTFYPTKNHPPLIKSKS